jgi:hypothetical protein
VSRPLRIGLIFVAGLFFFLWHSPLLSEAGRIRGFNSDAAIIGLMGKKMLDGGGFDVFFWGQNYVGPLTSMFIAAAGAFTGGVDALALRLGVMTEMFLGIVLTGWAVSMVDRRAGIATMVALAVTPPVLLRMMITPLGAEMAFVLAGLLVLLFLRGTPPLLLGIAAGIGWWMNQQVVFALLAIGLVAAYRGRLIREVTIRRQPLAFAVSASGTLLFLTFIVRDLLALGPLPFLFGPATDALLLFLAPLPFVIRIRIAPLAAFAPLPRFVAGFIAGYAPVWLGRLLGWYEPTYVFAFRINYPSEVIAQVRAFGDVTSHWLGGNIVVFCVFVAFAVWRTQSWERVLFALIPIANILFFFFTSGGKPHYLIGSVGMLFGLAALGALELWRRSRALVVLGAAVALITLGIGAKTMHRAVLAEPDPLPLLHTVRANQCAVTYADFWIAYRYRLLDEERGAWIPYLSQNRSRTESLAMQRLPGQRCVVSNDGTVTRIAGDLPLTHAPPRSR